MQRIGEHFQRRIDAKEQVDFLKPLSDEYKLQYSLDKYKNTAPVAFWWRAFLF
jgi:hypothetical protein